MCACTAVLDELTSTAVLTYPGKYVFILPGRCTERPTAMFLGAYSLKLIYSELML